MAKRIIGFMLGLALLSGLGAQRLPPSIAAPATPAPLNPVAYLPLVLKSSWYVLQSGSPAYLRNYVNIDGCKWMGVVGQAFGLDGKPQLNLIAHLEGGGLNVDSITGSHPAIGPGAYQIVLGDHPIATTDTYQIQLRTPSGQALSQSYSFPTYANCDKNLILVNFEQEN